jgi:uncharacterized protein (TIGR02453 family)
VRSPFSGFPQEGLDFFRGLARHNDREWFQPRKAIFEERLRQPMRELVEALNVAMRDFAPAYVTDPDKAIYRIYRDTRFSPDKTPYKDHIAAIFPRRGMPRHHGACYYFQVSHKEVGIGGGVYMPPPESLMAIRRHIEEHHEAFGRILKSSSLGRLFGEMDGEQLSRVPKGFCAAHPAAGLLRYKQFLYWAELPADLATTPGLFREILTRFRAMAPFMDFLNAPLAAPKRLDPQGSSGD